jgi:two-component system sensor kinase FixL
MKIESLVPARSGTTYAGLRENFERGHTARTATAGVEWSVLRKDGNEIVVEIDMFPMVIGGEPLTLVAITDISERKRSEREAALQRDELAHLSRAASLSALSSSLAHELVQPLTAILSNAQAGVRILANQPTDLEEVRASLGYIVDNAKRAGDVIRKLRSMLRKDPIEFTRLDINDVVRDIMQIVRSDLIERRVDVVLDLQEGLPRVRGDRVQLQQVMMNLIMNAADAMSLDEQSRTLTIRTIATASGELGVQVEDTGTGISEEDLERIFAPFVTNKNGGMGLGLSVCTMLIEAHGGRLWATNNNAGGATLHFRLPRSGDDSDVRQKTSAGI